MCNLLVNRYTIHHFKIKNKQEKFVSEAYLEFGSYVQLLHCWQNQAVWCGPINLEFQNLWSQYMEKCAKLRKKFTWLYKESDLD